MIDLQHLEHVQGRQAGALVLRADESESGVCSVCPGHEGHESLMEKVSRSTFCLILPGDTQSRQVSHKQSTCTEMPPVG